MIFIFACSEDLENEKDLTDPIDQTVSTWSHVQEIFNKNCVSCHSEGTPQARQSDLILTPDLAYSQLIDRKPKNPAALADELLLVGTEGAKSLAKSFLWEKINAPNEDHFFSDHPQYGSLMPLPPSPPLTYGELEFIRKWIIEGAPETGEVADLTLLENSDRYEYETENFAPPPLPANGDQLHLGPFEVFPNNEREFFYYEALNNPDPVYIERVEIEMRRGSHHFILYGFEDDTPAFAIPNGGVIRDLRDQSGVPIFQNYLAMQFHEFIVGTQWQSLDYKMPKGIALKIPANYAFDMNSHYVNRTDQPSTGEVYVNLHYADPNEIEHIAKIVNFNNLDISLPPNKITTLQRTFTFKERVNVFQLWSHAHKLNTEFRVEIFGGDQNGKEIYFSDDWEHPPILELDPPIVLDRGQGFRLIATYNNTRDREVNFGLLSTNEMMILFGLYYSE